MAGSTREIGSKIACRVLDPSNGQLDSSTSANTARIRSTAKEDWLIRMGRITMAAGCLGSVKEMELWSVPMVLRSKDNGARTSSSSRNEFYIWYLKSIQNLDSHQLKILTIPSAPLVKRQLLIRDIEVRPVSYFWRWTFSLKSISLNIL